MFGDKRVEKKKTPVYKCNLNPIFNATFEFDVPWEQIGWNYQSSSSGEPKTRLEQMAQLGSDVLSPE